MFSVFITNTYINSLNKKQFCKVVIFMFNSDTDFIVKKELKASVVGISKSYISVITDTDEMIDLIPKHDEFIMIAPYPNRYTNDVTVEDLCLKQ